MFARRRASTRLASPWRSVRSRRVTAPFRYSHPHLSTRVPGLGLRIIGTVSVPTHIISCVSHKSVINLFFREMLIDIDHRLRDPALRRGDIFVAKAISQNRSTRCPSAQATPRARQLLGYKWCQVVRANEKNERKAKERKKKRAAGEGWRTARRPHRFALRARISSTCSLRGILRRSLFAERKESAPVSSHRQTRLRTRRHAEPSRDFRHHHG